MSKYLNIVLLLLVPIFLSCNKDTKQERFLIEGDKEEIIEATIYFNGSNNDQVLQSAFTHLIDSRVSTSFAYYNKIVCFERIKLICSILEEPDFKYDWDTKIDLNYIQELIEKSKSKFKIDFTDICFIHPSEFYHNKTFDQSTLESTYVGYSEENKYLLEKRE